jgi:hypothetical protein
MTMTPTRRGPRPAILHWARLALTTTLIAAGFYLALEWLTAGGRATAATSLFVSTTASILFGVTASRGPNPPGGLGRVAAQRVAAAGVAVAAVTLLAGVAFRAWPHSVAGLLGAATLLAAWATVTAILIVRVARSDRAIPLIAASAFLGTLLLSGIIAAVLVRWTGLAQALSWLPPLPARALLAWAFTGPDGTGSRLGPAASPARAAVVLACWTVATGVAAALLGRRAAAGGRAWQPAEKPTGHTATPGRS